jgi:hypothetical protein
MRSPLPRFSQAHRRSQGCRYRAPTPTPWQAGWQQLPRVLPTPTASDRPREAALRAASHAAVPLRRYAANSLTTPSQLRFEKVVRETGTAACRYVVDGEMRGWLFKGVWWVFRRWETGESEVSVVWARCVGSLARVRNVLGRMRVKGRAGLVRLGRPACGAGYSL